MKRKKNSNKDILIPADFSATEADSKNPLDISAFEWAGGIKPKSYLSAIDFITNQAGMVNSISNHLNFLTSPEYQPSILSAVSGIQNDLLEFGSVQSYLPKFDQFNSPSILDYSRQATLAISGMTAPSIITGLASSITENYQPWYESNIAKSSILSSTAYASLNVADTSKNIATIIGTQNLSTLSIQSSIVKATEFSLFAEKSICEITQENLGSRITLQEASKNYLASSFLELSNSYSSLLKSYEKDPLSYIGISPSISRIAPIEYFSSSNLLEVISVKEDITPEEELLKNEIQYENEILLSRHLPKIDERLYKMWKGAIEAFNSNNSDRVRHFSVSIRELFTHLFHILAPDDLIKKWTTDPAHYHEGRPTRKTRLLFLCRNITNDPFKIFVKKDVDATIAFIDVFQKGTHDIDPIFSPNDLIVIRASWLFRNYLEYSKILNKNII